MASVDRHILPHISPFRAHLGDPAPAIRRTGLEIAEAAVRAQVMLSGDLAAADVVYAIGRTAGLDLSDEPNRKVGADPYAVWLAPDKRLLVTESADRNAFLQDLAAALSGRFATAADVTDGLAVLDLGGDRLPDLLAMACALDLDPRCFGPGRSARTLLANVPVILYRHGTPGGFRLHVDASVIGYLWTWLEQAATAIATDRPLEPERRRNTADER
jgi:sarcosine oxidase subunit gamma